MPCSSSTRLCPSSWQGPSSTAPWLGCAARTGRAAPHQQARLTTGGCICLQQHALASCPRKVAAPQWQSRSSLCVHGCCKELQSLNSRFASRGFTWRLCFAKGCSQCEQTTGFIVRAECLGVGLVRTFDAAEGLLYILTPLPLNALQRVKLLQVPIVCHMLFLCGREVNWHAECIMLCSDFRAQGECSFCGSSGREAGPATRASTEWSHSLSVPQQLVHIYSWHRCRRNQEPQQLAESRADGVTDVMTCPRVSWHECVERRSGCDRSF